MAGDGAAPVSHGLLVCAIDVCMPCCAAGEPGQLEFGMGMVPLLARWYAFQFAEDAPGEPPASGPRLKPLLRWLGCTKTS